MPSLSKKCAETLVALNLIRLLKQLLCPMTCLQKQNRFPSVSHSRIVLLAASLPLARADPSHCPFISLFLSRQAVTYDAEAWDSKVIHFSGDCHDSRGEGSKNRRPLIHFYAFMMHADALVDARVKRFARDRLRYRDSIFCKASQVGWFPLLLLCCFPLRMHTAAAVGAVVPCVADLRVVSTRYSFCWNALPVPFWRPASFFFFHGLSAI